jgi:hypothetical protein
LPPTVAEFGDNEDIITLPPLAHDNSGDYLQAIKNSQFDNKAHFHENLTNNRPSSQPPVDQMAMSSNNWGTNTFQYEEYDPNRDIINLEGLKQ